MASKVYFSPFIPTFNSNGLPVANARLYFFYTGTTDLAPIFQDSALTIPMANPVISDGAARYPNIYLDEMITYRVRETGKTGAPLADDIDPYVPGMAFVMVPDLPEFTDPNGAAIVGFIQVFLGSLARNVQTKLREISISLMDFDDVDPTGATDSSDGIEAAIAAALSQGRPLFVPPGVYRHDRKIVVKSRNFNPLGVASMAAFARSLMLIGEGPLTSVFRSYVPNDYGWSFETDLEPQFTFNGTTANGSAIVTGILSTAAIEIGAVISGAGIQAGSTVLSKTTFTITLSLPATASATVVLTHSIFRAMTHGGLVGIGFDANTGIAGTSGVRIRSQYFMKITGCIFNGFKNDGAKIYCEDGDYDGSVQIEFELSLFHNNGRWGLDAKAIGNHNEISSVLVDKCWFQENGTTEAFVPVITPGVDEPGSGALRWKGQNLDVNSCAFTINKNVTFLVPGGGGIATTFTVKDTAFENCVDRAVLVTGCLDFEIRSSHLYTSAAYPTLRGFETIGTTYAIRSGLYQNIRVRAGNGVAITAFKNTTNNPASSKGVRAAGTDAQDFGYAGQTMFDGDWEFPTCENQCIISYPGGSFIDLLPGPGGGYMTVGRRAPGSGNDYDTGDFDSYLLRAAGIRVDVAGLADGLYNLYTADVANLITLQASAAATTTRFGHIVKGGGTGEEGKVFVGRCIIAAGSLVTTAAANFCNAPYLKGFGYQWVDSTGAVRRKDTAPTTDLDGTLV